MSESLDLAQAAELTGVSVKTIRRAIKDGRLPASTVVTPRGEAYRVDADTVQALFGSGRKRPPMAGNPLDGVTAELRALRETIERQNAEIEALKGELHDARGQIHQLHDQVIRSLPAPKRRSWWGRAFGPRE